MKITICGSIAFYDEMTKAQHRLESMGHQIKLPPHQVQDEHGQMIPVQQYYQIRKTSDEADTWVWGRKQEAMMNHFEEVAWADAIVVMNCAKNGIDGYIGANTLLEMGLALYLRKKIYLLNSVPDISYREELLGMQPIVLSGDLSLIKDEAKV